jgi:hypothetical protein
VNRKKRVKFLLSDSLSIHRLSCSLRRNYVCLTVQNQIDQNRDVIRRLIEIRFDVAVYHSIRKKLDHEDQIYRALHVTCFSNDDVDRKNEKEIQILDQIQSLIRCRVLSESSEFVSQRMMKIKVA